MVTNTKLLFVDDETRITSLLRMIFREKYEIFTAESGVSALKIVSKEDIQVIVTDQRMPGMSGSELLAKVREISPSTIRLLLSGYTDLVSIIGAINEGEVHRFLTKPWEMQDLESAISEGVALSFAIRAEASTLPLSEPEDYSLARAAHLLAIDGVDSSRYETLEFFTEDFSVIGASTISAAKGILASHEVGVIITDTHVAGEDASEFLKWLRTKHPCVMIVVFANTADSCMLIKLINDAGIYRFTIKPLAPNILRLAVSGAMKEHHRRRVRAQQTGGAGQGLGSFFAEDMVRSLGRFTTVSD